MASNIIDIAITGSAGRMGQRLVALAKADGSFNIVGAIERPDHAAQGRDAGEVCGIGPIGVPITFDLKKDDWSKKSLLFSEYDSTETKIWVREFQKIFMLK